MQTTLFMIIGVLFTAAISMCFISLSICALIDKIKYRKEIALKNRWIYHLSEIDRYCDYEFRQIGLMAREMKQAFINNTGFNVENFRELLREKEKEIKK